MKSSTRPYPLQFPILWIIYMFQRQTFDGLIPVIHHLPFLSLGIMHHSLNLIAIFFSANFQKTYTLVGTCCTTWFGELILRLSKYSSFFLTKCDILTLTIFHNCTLFPETEQKESQFCIPTLTKVQYQGPDRGVDLVPCRRTWKYKCMHFTSTTQGKSSDCDLHEDRGPLLNFPGNGLHKNLSSNPIGTAIKKEHAFDYQLWSGIWEAASTGREERESRHLKK